MSTSPNDAIGALRDSVLQDYAPKKRVAAEFGKCVRTIDRWKRLLGLRSIKVGNEDWIYVPSLRSALTGQPATPPPGPSKRPRGRPRKVATASKETTGRV
jgi:hypothetical protein